MILTEQRNFDNPLILKSLVYAFLFRIFYNSKIIEILCLDIFAEEDITFKKRSFKLTRIIRE